MAKQVNSFLIEKYEDKQEGKKEHCSKCKKLTVNSVNSSDCGCLFCMECQQKMWVLNFFSNENRLAPN